MSRHAATRARVTTATSIRPSSTHGSIAHGDRRPQSTHHRWTHRRGVHRKSVASRSARLVVRPLAAAVAVLALAAVLDGPQTGPAAGASASPITATRTRLAGAGLPSTAVAAGSAGPTAAVGSATNAAATASAGAAGGLSAAAADAEPVPAMTAPAADQPGAVDPSHTYRAVPPVRVSRSMRRTALEQPALKPGQTVPGVWVKPNPGPMTSCFCVRWGVLHKGIDLAGPLGSPIRAVGDGVVLEAGPANGFGNWVVIRHRNGDVSIYGHMRYFFVHAGQHVKAGQKIALVGSEGQSTGPHLHFEVHRGGLAGPAINPVPWLKSRGIKAGRYDPNG